MAALCDGGPESFPEMPSSNSKSIVQTIRALGTKHVATFTDRSCRRPVLVLISNIHNICIYLAISGSH